MNNEPLKNSEIDLFSKDELTIIHDTEFFRLKSTVTQKFYQLFGELIQEIKEEIPQSKFVFPRGMDLKNGRITKGENYLGLPYVVADFPKIFNQEGVFTFRTWFWWGNYVLFTWHLSGTYLRVYQNHLISKFEDFQKAELLIFIGEDEWQQHITDSSYLDLNHVNKKTYVNLVKERPYFKVTQKLSFQDVENISRIGKDIYEVFIK